MEEEVLALVVTMVREGNTDKEATVVSLAMVEKKGKEKMETVHLETVDWVKEVILVLEVMVELEAREVED